MSLLQLCDSQAILPFRRAGKRNRQSSGYRITEEKGRRYGCVRAGIEGGRVPESAMNEPIEQILSKWQLLTNGKPNNGAVVLFSNNIYEYPQFRLRLARFIGTDKNEFLDNQRIEGNFFDLLDAGMAFFLPRLHLKQSKNRTSPTLII